MKQNGFRLVQRKFAQGVPLPASSGTAPPPQERKPEPPCPPRSVYHNNMSARSLLDIVALQNIHKHKQPMVLLERLRDDEIPSAPARAKVRVALRKRRNGLRAAKNNMCLRSGKRKSPDAVKGPVRKRKKLSSESTDDIPLVYFSKPNPAKPLRQSKLTPDKREKPSVKRDTVARRGAERSAKTRLSVQSTTNTDRSDDGSDFTFKEPSSPVRGFRGFKKKSNSNNIDAGRPLRKASLPKLDSRRSGLRSAGRLALRLREKRLSAKRLPKPVTRRSMPFPQPMVKDETPPSPSPSPSPQPGPSGINGRSQSKVEIVVPSSENGSLRDSGSYFNLYFNSRDDVSVVVPSSVLAEFGYTTPAGSVNCDTDSNSDPIRLHFDTPTSDSDRIHDWCIDQTVQAAIEQALLKTNQEIDTDSTMSETKDFNDFPSVLETTMHRPIAERYVEATEIEVIPTRNERECNGIGEINIVNTPSQEINLENSDVQQNTEENRQVNSEINNENNVDENRQVNSEINNENNVDENHQVLPGINNQETDSNRPENSVINNQDNMNDNREQNKVNVQDNTDNRPENSDRNNQVMVVNSQGDSNKINLRKKRGAKRDKEQSLLDLKKQKEKKLAQKKAQMNNAKGKKTNETVAKTISKGTKKAAPKRTKPAPEKSTRLLRNSTPPARAAVTARTPVAAPAPVAAPTPVAAPAPAHTPAPTAAAVAAPAAPNPDVYEFVAELETSRPPSSLRARRQTRTKEPQAEPQPSTSQGPQPSTSQRPPQQPVDQPVDQPDTTTDPTTPEDETADASLAQITALLEDDKEVFLDVFPGSVFCMQVTPKKSVTKRLNCLNVRIVKKEVCTAKNSVLIPSSPALLDRFLSSLSSEESSEINNMLANAARSGETNDPIPSSSTIKIENDGASTSQSSNSQSSTSQSSSSASTSSSSNYLDQNSGTVLEAPTFHPTVEEFADPIKYYDRIAPLASPYGLCKIVPPEGFAPPCNMSEAIRFAVIYQYISKMYNRWGPVSRELAAIKAHLRTQSVVFARSPLLDGSEVNLPKLYYAVERNGGLTKVIQRKRWGRVADEMKLTKLQHPERKLDPIYMRYLLPYATLSDQERQKIMAEVESCWTTKYQKMLDRARNPFQRQNRMLGGDGESESDEDNEDGDVAGALKEAEDCIVQGRIMNLATFKKIATSLMDAHFEPNKQPPSAAEVEKAYWRAVLLATDHIVANTASIDTGEEGYGFPKDPDDEYGTHPWNLKVLARNPNNVLRYLGSALGVTVPTLHLGMLFSTSCWHRDPHGLPWTEYMHSGAEKIWYGIPRDESSNFRRAVETLCPAYCQNKSIWLASEITMVPPNILSEHGVKLSRVLQRPGEYVLVFPEAHSCSITTGFAISESVYFASNTWLSSVYKLFQELRNSCEPTMFSLEQLLLSGSRDPDAPQHVSSVLATLLAAELEHRRALEARGLKVEERPAAEAPLNTSYFRAWNARDQDECEYCRSTLYLSKVIGLTGRKSALCPEHAIRLLEARKYRNIELSTLEFVSAHSTAALEEMLERLEASRDSPADQNDSERECIDLTGPEPPTPRPANVHWIFNLVSRQEAQRANNAMNSPSTSQASTSQASTSQASTSQASTSLPSTSHANT